MKLVIISFLFFLTSGFASAECELETFYKVVKINTNQDHGLIKSSNCSETINKVFVQFISETKGVLNGEHLSKYFKNEYEIDVVIKPSKFTVLSFQDLLSENLNNDSITLKSLTSLHSQSSFNLNKGDSIRIECADCKTAGNKSIVTYINTRKVWLSAKLHIKRKGYILIKSVQNLRQKLDPSFFRQVIVSDSGTQMLFKDIENIRFFKFNRLLKNNELVKQYDLQPRRLIKYGQKVKVLLRNQNIQLNSIATSRGSGFFGDSIELVNPKTKKIIMAKITDYNKAVVEL